MRGRRAPRSFLRLGAVGTVRGGVVLLIAMALLASSCTGSFEDFERAVELAMDKGTVRMESTTVLRGIPGPAGEEAELRFVVEGAFDLPADRGELTMTFGLTPPPPPDEPVPAPCRMVMDTEATYLADAHGPGWLRTPLFPPEETEQPGATDPREAFELLKAVFGDVDAIAREEIRGVQTTHWKVFVDVDRILAEQGQAPERGFLASLTQQKFPMDVWIDADGLPRRIAYSLRDQTPEGPVEMESTTDIFDYGEPLSIEVPPPAEVREEPDPDRAFGLCIGAPMGS